MTEPWTQINQKYLAGKINEVKALLRNHIAASAEGAKPQATEPSATVGRDGTAPPAIETLSSMFGLSPFEKQTLLLCAAVELDSEVSGLCTQAQGNPKMAYPTFSLALSCLPDAHWSAIAPSSPLRRFRLIEVNSASITTSPLIISERVLHYLTGVFYLDSQLQGIIKPIASTEQPVESQMRVAERILSVWRGRKGKLPLIQLSGVDGTGKLAVAQKALKMSGLNLWLLPADFIPQKPDEASALVQLWIRESALLRAGLFVAAEDADAAVQKLSVRFIEQLSGPVFLATNEHWQIPNVPSVTLQINKPLKDEQRQLWHAHAKNLNANMQEAVSALVSQFDLNASAIKAAADEAVVHSKEHVGLKDALWASACAVSRPRVLELAQQITPKATLDSLVLPERERQLLKEIIAHVAQRHRVYEEWGFENAGSRGLGISALFSGQSGTGKTMAAEVIAKELRLDLFRIDLSAVVSKYIGETEKNLRKLFDAAEDGGAILFFDEADALFGKRTEVRDSHDRYANIEVNYLLQRMESYRGLAILATNMKEALDTAFVRRLKFIVNFPFPDEKSRMEIWKQIYPKETPIGNLDFVRLAKLNIAGGNIYNIALYSAFLAANEGVAVSMRHVKRAVQVEYAKTNRSLTQAEADNW